MLLVMISFVWFGRDKETYIILLLAGLVISFISFLTVICKSDTRKSKWLWTLIVVLSVGIQCLTEPFFITISYRLFIEKHEKELTSVTELLSSKNKKVFMTPSSELWTSNGFSQDEANFIKDEFKNTGIHFIIQDSDKIYYMTGGMLDVSHGVYYFFTDKKPDKRYRRITGNWYY